MMDAVAFTYMLAARAADAVVERDDCSGALAEDRLRGLRGLHGVGARSFFARLRLFVGVRVVLGVCVRPALFVVRRAVTEARVGRSEKVHALKRLAGFPAAR